MFLGIVLKGRGTLSSAIPPKEIYNDLVFFGESYLDDISIQEENEEDFEMWGNFT